MPRQTHDQRHDEQNDRDLVSPDWSQWLAPAMAEASMDVNTLVERARKKGATFDKTNVSRWLNRKKNPDPNHAVIVAEILGKSPAEALRAGGHGLLADAFIQSVEAAAARGRRDRETELREELAELDEELATRLARYLPPTPPPSQRPREQLSGEDAS